MVVESFLGSAMMWCTKTQDKLAWATYYNYPCVLWNALKPIKVVQFIAIANDNHIHVTKGEF